MSSIGVSKSPGAKGSGLRTHLPLRASVRAGFVVPNFLAEEELCQYLADLFHESASPSNGEVFQIE